MISFNSGELSEFTRHAFLVFLVSGPLYFFVISYGTLNFYATVSVSIIAGFSFSMIFSSIFYNLQILELGQAGLYFVAIGLLSGFCLMPKEILIEFRAKLYSIRPSNF